MSRVCLKECPLCGSHELVVALSTKDYFASGERYDIIRCQSCGFMMTQDVPSEEEIGRYYQSGDYISHTDSKDSLFDKLYHLIRSVMLSRKAALLLHYQEHRGTLLDIGAGTGYFPDFMKRKGWQVQATEKSPDARLFAMEHFAMEILPPEALDHFESCSFSVITLWHVLEHMDHLDAVWKRLHTVLKDDGVLFVAVPNYTSLDARFYNSYWAAYDVPRHLWHFSPGSMHKWAEKAGFRVVGLHRMPFDAFYVSLLSEKRKGGWLWCIRGLAVGFASLVESAFLRSRCSSLVYVLRKDNC